MKLKNPFQNWTQCTQLRLLAIAARSPKGEQPVITGFIVVQRRLTGLPAVTAGTPDDRRRDTGGASAKNVVISRENRPAAEQSPGGDRQVATGWLYNFVQGQENRPTSDGSRKIAIQQNPVLIHRFKFYCAAGLKARACSPQVTIDKDCGITFHLRPWWLSGTVYCPWSGSHGFGPWSGQT